MAVYQTLAVAPRLSGAQRLVPQIVEKPWGRQMLGPWGLGIDSKAPIGEIIHALPESVNPDPALLVKTLFTDAQLSVQVHPDAKAARRLGLARGKDEAWVVLAADAGARIGLGLAQAMTIDAVQTAARNGNIVDHLGWFDCKAGDVFFTPAGTIHAIGAGVTLFEVQQNCGLTWRLFDYGRQRPLQLDEALAVAHLRPWLPTPPATDLGAGRTLLVAGPDFVMERLVVADRGRLMAAGPLWMAVVGGDGSIDGQPIAAGEVWWAENAMVIEGRVELVVAYPGAAAQSGLWLAA